MLKSLGSDPSEWEGDYIRFSLQDTGVQKEGEDPQTTWQVTAKKDGFTLGEVKWFARWRKYVFCPAPDCLFEEVCLGDIADFLKWATEVEKTGL